MPQKRKRVSLRPLPVIILLLVVNLVAGLLYSQLTVMRRIRVDGAPYWDQQRLTGVVGQLKGVPCAQIDAARVEAQALQNPEVRSAHLSRNLFGSAVLTVGYRRPVARFYNKRDVALTIDGVVYPSSHLPDNLPTVEVADGASTPLLTIAGDWPAAKVARVVLKAEEIDSSKQINVRFGPGSEVCLNMGTGQVILGSCDDIDTKMRVLKERLPADPEYLSRVQALNLTVPSHPSEVPKATRKKQ